MSRVIGDRRFNEANGQHDNDVICDQRLNDVTSDQYTPMATTCNARMRIALCSSCGDVAKGVGGRVQAADG